MSCVLDGWLSQQCPGNGSATESLVERVGRCQEERLRETLRHVRANSRFYQRHFADFSWDLSSLAALGRLPFTRTEDIADWGDLLCVSQGDVARMVTVPRDPFAPVVVETSGTTGRPKRLAFSAADLERTRDFFGVGMSQLVRGGQRVLVLLPGAERPHGVTDLLRAGLERHGVRVLAGNPQATPETLREDLRGAPQCVVAAPSQLARLADFFVTGGKQPLSVLSSGEPLSSTLAARLRSVLGGEVLDHYGLTESGYGGGVECPAHDGYHLRELDCLIEVVDIRTGEPLPNGQIGEIVLTTLGREAMPLIRYRTGDAGRLLPGPCRCGSPLRRLGPIQGRIVRDGDSFHIQPLRKGDWRAQHPSL